MDSMSTKVKDTYAAEGTRNSVEPPHLYLWKKLTSIDEIKTAIVMRALAASSVRSGCQD
jgi:hypothetical protein